MKYVFLSYVREDSEEIDRLCDFLREHGIFVWLDREQIKPGQRWRAAIRQAIQEGAFFIACFSRAYNNRDRTFMNEELTLAIEELRLRPTHRSWFIPVMLPGGEVPDRIIGGGETLRDLQWVDLSEGGEFFDDFFEDEFTDDVYDGLRHIVHLITKETTRGAGLDFIQEIRTALIDRSEERLRGQLRALARETIDAVLDEFVNDKDVHAYGYFMRPVCEVLGNQFTKKHVLQLATRGGRETSTSGFIGLDELYDFHFSHMKSLNLPELFADNIDLYYYCRLRERYPHESLGSIMCRAEGDLEIDGISVDVDNFQERSPGKGMIVAFLWSICFPSPWRARIAYCGRRLKSWLRRLVSKA